MKRTRWIGVLCLLVACGDDGTGTGDGETSTGTSTATMGPATSPSGTSPSGTMTSADTGSTSDDTGSTGTPTTGVTTTTGGEESSGSTTTGMGSWDEDYPSCVDLAGDECGDDNCCATDAVPGGWFAMGRSEKLACVETPAAGEDCTETSLICLEGSVTWGCPTGTWLDLGNSDAGSGDDDELPEHAARAGFYGLDRYEVTVARMRAFVDAYDKDALLTALGGGAGAHPDLAGTEWDSAWDAELPDDADLLRGALDCDPIHTWTDAAGGNETYPINCVSWYLAYAFCAWDEGRLPTAAEWERASAGGDENRRYPWGNLAPTEMHANYLVSDNTPNVDVFAKPMGAARWGHQGIAGSVWEWVYDTYNVDWYTGDGSECDNCVNLETGGSKGLRGGDFQYSAPHMRGANRFNGTTGAYWLGAGIRCARD